MNRRQYYDARPRPHLRDCNMVVHYGAQGFSQAQLAQVIGVTTSTLKRWAQKCPRFAAAYEIAKESSLSYWERIGRLRLRDPKFNVHVYLKILSRFPEYRRRAPCPDDDASVTAPIIPRVVAMNDGE